MSDVDQLFEAALNITRDIFGEVRVLQDCDPEDADDSYTVFEVTSSEPVALIVAKESEWVARIREIVSGPKPFRLSIQACD